YLQSTCFLVLSRFNSLNPNSEFDIKIQRDLNGNFKKIKITVDKLDTVIENGVISVDGQSVSLPYDQKSIHIHHYGIFVRLESRRNFLSVYWEPQGDNIVKIWVSSVSIIIFFINMILTSNNEMKTLKYFCLIVGPANPPTCSNPSPSNTAETKTCACPEGKKKISNNCIEKEQCPCEYNGAVYQTGQTHEAFCELCECHSGKWVCKQNDCPSQCKIEVGSSITTFDGKVYTVNGNCDYVIAMVSHIPLQNFIIIIFILLSGLCGNFNGIVTDEFMASSGIMESTADAFAKSWATNTECEPPSPIPCIRSDNGKIIIFFCEQYTIFPECPINQNFSYNIVSCNSTCSSLSGNDISCNMNVNPVEGCGCLEGLYMNDEGKCVSKIECPCYSNGKIVNPGKTTINGQECNCENGVLQCTPPRSKFYIQFNLFKLLQFKNTIYTTCVSGCYCVDGYYKDDTGNCVPLDQCPCKYGNKVYSPGESVQNDCNTCTCNKGTWSCTHRDCQKKCQVYGDGHYQTFDTQWYSFDGNCEYSFVEDYCGESNGTFRITVESVPCCEEALTCSRSVKITLQVMTTDKALVLLCLGPKKVQHN
uniref:VWFD domain-containing protein n=1 Tax=Erpetoichthys calabaricus TaxID=27687 RepID=A0A8C4RGW8_ERPCA